MKWYKDINIAIREEEKNNINEDCGDIVDLYYDVKDEFLTFITTDIEDRDIGRIVDKTKQLAKEILGRVDISSLVLNMQKMSSTLVDHATNVANLAAFVGVHSGYTHQILLENLYLGGLFHDYGKINLMQQQNRENMTEDDYNNAILKHPAIGKAILLSETNFGDEILDIVGQHHECHDGSGHPDGINGSKIYELTKIVSVSNALDNYVRSGNGRLVERQKFAINELKKDNGHQFDPRILNKFVKCISHVIGDGEK